MSGTIWRAHRSFVANRDEFEGRLECESLDAETLAATLDIPMFSKAFATLKRESKRYVWRSHKSASGGPDSGAPRHEAHRARMPGGMNFPQSFIISNTVLVSDFTGGVPEISKARGYM